MFANGRLMHTRLADDKLLFSGKTILKPMINPLAEDLDYILENTPTIWNELQGKRIFITGGTGFFGSWLLESFVWANNKLKLNAKAVVLSRDPDSFASKCPHLFHNDSIEFQKGDIVDFEFPAGEFSHCIHAATELSPQMIKAHPLKVLDTIIIGTRRVLYFARQAKVKKMLLTSSGAIYGKQPTTMERIPETYSGAPDPTNPQQVYGEGKRIAELLCSLYAMQYGIEVKIARCFAFVGPYLPLDGHFAVGNFIKNGLDGVTIRVNGDGTPYRSYLYASDLMVCLWNILSVGKNGEPYNVGSGDGFPIEEIAHLVADCFDKPMKVTVLCSKKQGIPSERYVPEVTKLRQDEILLQENSFRTAVKKTIAWNLSFRNENREKQS